MTTSATWDTITEAITADAEKLKAMTTHGELYGWAKDHGLTGTQFAAVKRELRKIGVDYDAIREEVTRARLSELNADAAEGVPVIRLSAAGADAVNSYAVCDGEGTVLWYGTFFERDRHYHKEIRSALISAPPQKPSFWPPRRGSWPRSSLPGYTSP